MTLGRKAPAVIALVPLLLVNSVAFTGQLAFLRDHLSWPLIGDVAFAAALESIAVYLAYHAHVALLANDSALRLRLSAYGFALVIGAMNYSHYSRDWRPTFSACAVALMSASSPWLWGVHSRRASRDQLLSAGLIERRALRLGGTRWLWHPVRSARVMWHATWTGEQVIAAAIAAIEPPALPELPAATPAAEMPGGARHDDVLASIDSAANRIRYAARVTGSDQPAAIRDWLAGYGWTEEASNVRSVLRRSRKSGGQVFAMTGRAGNGSL